MELKNKKNFRVKFLGVLFLFLVFGLIIMAFVFKNELKKTELRWLYWDLKGKHHVDSTPTRVVHFYSDSLRIVGDLFEPESADKIGVKPPCILLLHGAGPLHRKTRIIQVLARKFCGKGYVVLAIDFRGYGDSQDPPSFSPKNFDFAKDILSSINYLINNVNIDTSKIYIIAHSFGAGVAISYMIKYGSINKAKKMVLIGPPRRVAERIMGANAAESSFFVERANKDMDLPYRITLPEIKIIGEHTNIEELVSMPHHIPLFLIDGEKESKNDLKALREIVANSLPQTNYWTVPGTGHYLNTYYSHGILWYEGDAVPEFVNRVDKWLRAK